MAMFKRNVGMHTSAEDAKRNILLHLHRNQVTDSRSGVSKSTLGFAAYPDYDFGRPQGAAFSVAKLVRELEEGGLVGWYVDSNRCGGYYLKPKGQQVAAEIDGQTALEKETMGQMHEPCPKCGAHACIEERT